MSNAKSIFNNFKVHTQYSICEGAIKIEDLADYCKKNKIKALGLSDSFNLCGALEFSEAISKAGTQPIIGTQINFKYGDTIGKLPIFAKSEKGYNNLVKLSSKSFLETKENSIPTCSLNDLNENKEDLIVLSGGIDSLFNNLIKKNFSWDLKIDFSLKENQSRFWYVSEEKLEPRLGNRYEEEGQNLERPLDIARRVYSLHADLGSFHDDMIVAEFLMKHPEHRFIIRRIQTNAWAPYSEIHDNLIDEHCKPIDMLRCKLSFFGASKFDPKSDRWVRVNLFQGAPLKNELNDQKNDDWWMPTLEYC